MFRSLHAPCSTALIAVAIALPLSSCAFGNHIRYDRAGDFEAPLVAKPARIVAVDRRPAILDHSHDPSWVGVQRSLLGVPYGVHTASGNSLGGDLAKMLGDSLKHTGADVEIRTLREGATDDEIVADAEQHHVRSTLVIIIRRWETESWMHTRLSYDLTLAAYAPGGAKIAAVDRVGARDLDSKTDARSSITDVVSDIFSTMLEEPSFGPLRAVR